MSAVSPLAAAWLVTHRTSQQRAEGGASDQNGHKQRCRSVRDRQVRLDVAQARVEHRQRVPCKVWVCVRALEQM